MKTLSIKSVDIQSGSASIVGDQKKKGKRGHFVHKIWKESRNLMKTISMLRKEHSTEAADIKALLSVWKMMLSKLKSLNRLYCQRLAREISVHLEDLRYYINYLKTRRILNS